MKNPKLKLRKPFNLRYHYENKIIKNNFKCKPQTLKTTKHCQEKLKKTYINGKTPPCSNGTYCSRYSEVLIGTPHVLVMRIKGLRIKFSYYFFSLVSKDPVITICMVNAGKMQ